ncbi:MAG: hypothetical protein FWF87_02995 [Synergistaceae bacterium]|nr:hypothetical protein [Synergistaceae bacterium]
MSDKSVNIAGAVLAATQKTGFQTIFGNPKLSGAGRSRSPDLCDTRLPRFARNDA